jgi:hypothetical protein
MKGLSGGWVVLSSKVIQEGSGWPEPMLLRKCSFLASGGAARQPDWKNRSEEQ